MAAYLKTYDPIPSLDGATAWLNGEVMAADLAGSPVLVHIWAVSCPVCKTNLPQLREWQERFAGIGLRTVAIHLPRGPQDADVDLVRSTAAEVGIVEPCAVDNEGVIGARFFSNGLWPHYFLFGPDGRLCSRGVGGLGLRLIENGLLRLADLPVPSSLPKEAQERCIHCEPEPGPQNDAA